MRSYLFSKLLFAEFIENIKLLRQDNIFKKATASKLNSHKSWDVPADQEPSLQLF